MVQGTQNEMVTINEGNRYGFHRGYGDTYTLEEIGENLGITIGRVR